jgi:long-chain acyl-CoA synthetase
MADRVDELFGRFRTCPAVQHDGGWTSWGELGAVSADLVAHLQATGVGRHTRVGLLMHERPECVAALVGLLANGSVVSLMSPLQPPEVTVAQVGTAGLTALVGAEDDWAKEGLWSQAGGLAVTVVLGRFRCEASGRSGGGDPGASGVAMTVMTSGTTGAPKAVPITHDFLGRTVLTGAPGDPTAAKGAVINSLPLCSVGGALAILTAMWRGRPLAVMDRFDVRRWAELVRQHAPRRTGGPPALLRMVLDAEIPREVFATVTCFETGSAPLDPDLADEFQSAYGVPVLSAYGATEFLSAVAGWTLEDHNAWWTAKRGSAGRALTGFDLRVVDDGGREAPCGMPGRLEVSSQHGGPAPEWIATNDEARIDTEGFVFILGRLDDVIIRGGFKVSKGEVEAALLAHPDVTEAAVVGLPDERLGQVPAAAVVRRRGARLTPDELESWARARLAPYKVPARIRVVDSLPRNQMMKVANPGLQELFDRPAGGSDDG